MDLDNISEQTLVDTIVYDKSMTLISHFGITYLIMFKDPSHKAYVWCGTMLKGADLYASLNIGDSAKLTLSSEEHEYLKDSGSNITKINDIKC